MKNTIKQLKKRLCSQFNIETLETRNSDALDFHELGVWEINAIIEAAYNAGKNSQK